MADLAWNVYYVCFESFMRLVNAISINKITKSILLVVGLLYTIHCRSRTRSHLHNPVYSSTYPICLGVVSDDMTLPLGFSTCVTLEIWSQLGTDDRQTPLKKRSGLFFILCRRVHKVSFVSSLLDPLMLPSDVVWWYVSLHFYSKLRFVPWVDGTYPTRSSTWPFFFFGFFLSRRTHSAG